MTAQRVFALVIAVLGAAIAASLGAPAAQAGGGCHEPLTDAHAAGVDLRGGCFLPAVLRVDTGAAVVFTNRDPIPHTITGVGRASGSASAWGSFDELRQYQSVSYTFASGGVYPYYCALHPGMVGAIVVGDGNPSLAVMDASANEGLVSAAHNIGAAPPATNQASRSGGDGLTRRLAIFAAAIVVAATFAALVVRRRSHT